jgi:N6-adenosine-specific RNA methylase IME4
MDCHGFQTGIIPHDVIVEICAFPITSIMHEDSILWVWTTNYHMQVIPDLLRFRHVTILTWAKAQAGAGDWLRGQDRANRTP